MAISCALAGNGQDSTSQTTYTFSSLSFGTAAADRYIFVLVNAGITGTAQTISSITVGGISASSCAEITHTNLGFAIRSAIWVAAVPTGTTGNVVVTFASAMDRCAVTLFAATGVSPTVSASASDTSDPCVASINVPAGGLLVGTSGTANSSGTPTCTWTNVTERYDTNITGTTTSTSGVFDTFVSAQTALSITADWTATSIIAAGVWASFAPTASANGTLAVTLANASLSAASTVQIKAALAKTLGDATLSATGGSPGSGQLSQTLADATLSAASTLKIAGTLSKTLGNVTLSSAATVKIVGALAVTLANASLSSAAAVQIKAALARTLADASLSAAAQAKIQATLAATLDDATLASIAASINYGNLSVTLEDAVLIATGNDGWTRRGNAGGTWTNIATGSAVWTPKHY